MARRAGGGEMVCGGFYGAPKIDPQIVGFPGKFRAQIRKSLRFLGVLRCSIAVLPQRTFGGFPDNKDPEKGTHPPISETPICVGRRAISTSKPDDAMHWMRADMIC